MLALKKFLDRSLAAVCVVLFALLVVIVVWQVFARQVISDPSTWSEEAARYTFVWLGFFASALVFSERGHIAVDFVVRKLPGLVQRVIAVLVQALIIAFALIGLVWGGLRAAQGAWDTNLTALPTQIGVMYLVMPITGVLITVYALYHVVAVLRGAELAVAPTDDAEAI
ncbi:TRAP-type C4-dicarboxylate transport system, small permease component [Promicromonospora umidemergens]|uniref:TRAP transporter small permease n=1 Tax=Promicromonospora umidemergens TaxID=629679 RepID=A0ABP8WKE5_9MICO|nr:TRAP transporter small permease [Promicromonospora umidemergens]MCP2283909.1 TRAP-type C4-dicarboxylate transport system, small permease component [Promicromonospora umidemergens]